MIRPDECGAAPTTCGSRLKSTAKSRTSTFPAVRVWFRFGESAMLMVAFSDFYTKRPKGYAYVEYATAEQAETAMNKIEVRV